MFIEEVQKENNIPSDDQRGCAGDQGHSHDNVELLPVLPEDMSESVTCKKPYQITDWSGKWQKAPDQKQCRRLGEENLYGKPYNVGRTDPGKVLYIV